MALQRMNLSIGYRCKDRLPVVVKSMNKSSELEILRMLNQDRYRHPHNHTIPILDVYDAGDSSGTEGYRAPEVNGRDVFDPYKADMWSVGATLGFLTKV